MTITATRPGLHALNSPFTPIGWTTGGTPVYPAQGGRVSGGSINFDVRDDDGTPDFDDEDDDRDDDEDDEPDEEPAARRRTARRRDEPEPDADDAETDWTPPDRDSYERLTTALKRANSEAGKRRRVGKVMDRLGIDDLDTWLTERGIDPATGHPFGADVVSPGGDDFEDETPARGRRRDDDYEREEDVRPRDDERAARIRDRDVARRILAAEQRAKAAAREEYMPIMAEQAARLALRDAGFNGDGKRLDRVLRMIDPASLDLEADDTGFELVGIDEAIEEIKSEFPEFFEDRTERRPARRAAATGRTTRGARDVDGGERGRPSKKPLTWAEQMVEQMGRRGR